jgi:hypothetical protein
MFHRAGKENRPTCGCISPRCIEVFIGMTQFKKLSDVFIMHFNVFTNINNAILLSEGRKIAIPMLSVTMGVTLGRRVS